MTRCGRAGFDRGDADADKRESYITYYLTAAFILEHWHGGVRAKGGATEGWTCDRFDPLTNLCMAHDERPPVCSGFPWYGKTPAAEHAKGMSVNCSYWADIPEENQPKAVRVELRRSKAA